MQNNTDILERPDISPNEASPLEKLLHLEHRNVLDMLLLEKVRPEWENTTKDWFSGFEREDGFLLAACVLNLHNKNARIQEYLESKERIKALYERLKLQCPGLNPIQLLEIVFYYGIKEPHIILSGEDIKLFPKPSAVEKYLDRVICRLKNYIGSINISGAQERPKRALERTEYLKTLLIEEGILSIEEFLDELASFRPQTPIPQIVEGTQAAIDESLVDTYIISKISVPSLLRGAPPTSNNSTLDAARTAFKTAHQAIFEESPQENQSQEYRPQL